MNAAENSNIDVKIADFLSICLKISIKRVILKIQNNCCLGVLCPQDVSKKIHYLLTHKPLSHDEKENTADVHGTHECHDVVGWTCFP
jgi:hypothetical protein